jgi:Fe2+ transport system protein B
MRYGTASFLAAQGTSILHRKTRKQEDIDSLRIDQWLLHRFWGPVLTLLFFLVFVYILLVASGFIECLLMTMSEDLIALIPVDGGFLLCNETDKYEILLLLAVLAGLVFAALQTICMAVSYFGRVPSGALSVVLPLIWSILCFVYILNRGRRQTQWTGQTKRT